jgi:flagellar hook assembly protein FlgD
LLISEGTDILRVVGQELVIVEENQYSSNLLNFAWKDISDIEDDISIEKFEFYQNFPNPFNSTTTIRYDLPQSMKVKISIYNVLGGTVKILKNNFQWSGTHSVQWNGKDENGHSLSSGIYFCGIQAGEFSQSIKLILLK